MFWRDVFGGELVVAGDFLFRSALRHEAQDECDGQFGATYHRLAHKHGGAGGDVFLPIHLREPYNGRGALEPCKLTPVTICF